MQILGSDWIFIVPTKHKNKTNCSRALLSDFIAKLQLPTPNFSSAAEKFVLHSNIFFIASRPIYMRLCFISLLGATCILLPFRAQTLSMSHALRKLRTPRNEYITCKCSLWIVLFSDKASNVM